MSKKVVYNGGTESYYNCSSPSKLVAGKEYEVIAFSEREWQTDYTLKGVEGSFNSVWFNEVQTQPTICMALGYEVPEVGKKYQCYGIGFVKGSPKLSELVTPAVNSVEYVGNNIYEAITANRIYVVTVNAKK